MAEGGQDASAEKREGTAKGRAAAAFVYGYLRPGKAIQVLLIGRILILGRDYEMHVGFRTSNKAKIGLCVQLLSAQSEVLNKRGVLTVAPFATELVDHDLAHTFGHLFAGPATRDGAGEVAFVCRYPAA